VTVQINHWNFSNRIKRIKESSKVVHHATTGSGTGNSKAVEASYLVAKAREVPYHQRSINIASSDRNGKYNAEIEGLLGNECVAVQ
jgi:hypothetical protein